MSVYKLPLVLGPQPEGGYVATCPFVPELVTEGETVDEAVHNAKDALEALIEGFEAIGRPLPAALSLFTEQDPIWFDTAVAVP